MFKLPHLINLAKSRYVISIAVFIVWICFFDRNDLVTQWDRKKELRKLEASVSFYEGEIETTKKDLTDLNNSPATLEKFAREKFYLKRQNEDVFLVSDTVVKKN